MFCETRPQSNLKKILHANESEHGVVNRFRVKDVACSTSFFLKVIQRGVALRFHDDMKFSFRFSHSRSGNYSCCTLMWPYFYFLSIKMHSDNMQIRGGAMNASLLFNSRHTNSLSKFEHIQKRRDPNVFQISIPLCFRLRMRAAWNCV